MDIIEIKGKINTAICYARVVEDEAIEQIRRMCDYPMTEGSRIRIMPDVHSGKGCTIGTTMTITDKAVPNVVGVDIGCGMYTVNLGKVDIDFVKVDEAAHFIPSGMNVWEGRQERFDLTELACYRELKDTKRLERSLGTLGGGNHFIEIDEAGDGTKYLVIHSGSRNLGKQVAELYQKLAINLDRGYGDYLEKRDEIIRTYKEQGRRSEIQDALKQLHWQVYESETSMPEDLCYLSGKYLEDYLHDVEICQAFARRSREKMAEIILERTGMAGREAFHTIHNYIDKEMQTMTSAYANKMLKSLEEDKAFWVNKEATSSTYVAAINEEPVVPEYDYTEVVATITSLDEKIAIIKHALNVTNSNEKVQVGDAEMSIDTILIKMAQLNKRKSVLDQMRKQLPKAREEQRSYMSRNTVPEYRYINYDLELIKKEYEAVSKTIMEMQMALDKYNQTVQFEVDI